MLYQVLKEEPSLGLSKLSYLNAHQLKREAVPHVLGSAAATQGVLRGVLRHLRALCHGAVGPHLSYVRCATVQSALTFHTPFDPLSGIRPLQ